MYIDKYNILFFYQTNSLENWWEIHSVIMIFIVDRPQVSLNKHEDIWVLWWL